MQTHILTELRSIEVADLPAAGGHLIYELPEVSVILASLADETDPAGRRYECRIAALGAGSAGPGRWYRIRTSDLITGPFTAVRLFNQATSWASQAQAAKLQQLIDQAQVYILPSPEEVMQ